MQNSTEEKIYVVERIQEDDYGCEELPEGEKPKVICVLRAKDGTQRAVRAEDDALTKKGIVEGSRVILRDRELFPAKA